MATDRTDDVHLERHGRRARWFHAANYLITIPTILTGLWILTGGEGHPSPLARITGMGDTELHVWLGRGLAVLVLALLLGGPRAIWPFIRETLRHDGGESHWWVRLPAAVVTGRFARHEGTFDPGQRLANVAIVGGLLVLTGTGLGLTIVHGGSAFVTMATIHRWSALVVTAAIAGHMIVAAGILPGYRGVWRSMHLGGKLPADVAHRLWPGWSERAEEREHDVDTTPTRHETSEPYHAGHDDGR